VRSIAKSNGREIAEFKQLGGEIELIKKKAEGIMDPLIPTIRNAWTTASKLLDAHSGRKAPGRTVTMSASQEWRGQGFHRGFR